MQLLINLFKEFTGKEWLWYYTAWADGERDDHGELPPEIKTYEQASAYAFRELQATETKDTTDYAACRWAEETGNAFNTP